LNSRSLWIAGGAVAIGSLLLPYAASSYYLGLASKMLVFALFAMSLDLLVGYAGLFSLGHAAFFGVAAYTVGLLTVRAGASAWLAFPAGILAAGVTSALFGLLALRARGSYFIMITLALAQVLWGIAFGWGSMTGGDNGLPNIPRPDLGLPWSLVGTTPFYYFVLGIVAAAAAVLTRIVRSPFGYALRGIRESESRMSALGYNVWRYKYLALVIGGLFAGVAGCLYAYLNSFVGPDYVYVTRSAEALLMVILGGAGTLVGPAIGAGLIILFENVVSTYTERWLMILGAVYILVTLFAPRGIMGLLQDSRRRKSGS
jgi:branched-chain amino acid transport system permease protein